MKKMKITTLVILCILTVGLCGILVYGIAGHSIYVGGYNGGGYASHGSPQLVMEKEIPLDGIDHISLQYDMNNNDIRIYESEEDILTIREYNELDLEEDELSTVTVTGSGIEIRGKKERGEKISTADRKIWDSVRIWLHGDRTAGILQGTAVAFHSQR